MKSRLVNLILLHVIVVIFGFTGILGKLITIGSDLLVFYRMGIAFICLFAFLIITRRLNFGNARILLITCGVGVITAAHWITFFEAIKVSNVSVTLSTMASTSLFVALLSPLFDKAKIRTYEVFLGLLVIVGLALVFGFSPGYTWGIILALISSFLAALFTLFNFRLIKELSSSMISTVEMGAGCLIVFCYLLVTKSDISVLLDVAPMDWLWLLLLGIVATAFAFVVSVEVMKVISPFTVAISVNLEPIYSIILALVIFGEQEKMSFGFYIGATLIVGAILLNAVIKKQRKTAN